MASEIDLKKGIVTWFDVKRGYGFITPEEGGENVFVHQSSIKAVGFRSLAKGDPVEFFVSVGDDGLRKAVSVTGPGGKGRFAGACYCCGKVGHKAIHCKSDVVSKSVGPCYNCCLMGHLARDCSYPRGVEQRNWAELPRDVLWMIFKKFTTVEILRSVQYVCRSWRQLSYEPELWRHIGLTMPSYLTVISGFESMEMFFESLAKMAVDRSEGCVEDFQLKRFKYKKTEELIGYISNRITKLRRLRLITINHMSKTTLAQAIRKFPLLEELEITHCLFSSKFVEVVGSACPQLKTFKLNVKQYSYLHDYDSDAFPIAKHMQQLQHLELIGNRLTNIGLLAILNSCHNLQCLDIRGCLNVKFDEDIRRKCANIKELRHPMDSTADFELRSYINDPCIRY